MFGLGPWEILMILAIVLILFGAGRLPEAIGQLKSGLLEFRKGGDEGVTSLPAKDSGAKEPANKISG